MEARREIIDMSFYYFREKLNKQISIVSLSTIVGIDGEIREKLRGELFSKIMGSLADKNAKKNRN